MGQGELTTHEQVRFVEGRQDISGNPLIRIMGKIKLDVYDTNGYPLDLSGDIKNLLMFTVENVDGYFFSYDYSAKKLKAYYGEWDDSTPAGKELFEVADGAPLGAPTIRYEALGT